MLDQLFSNPAYQALADYLSFPRRALPFFPGCLPAILAFYARAEAFRRLQLLALALAIVSTRAGT
jgi:hypothetical protein